MRWALFITILSGCRKDAEDSASPAESWRAIEAPRVDPTTPIVVFDHHQALAGDPLTITAAFLGGRIPASPEVFVHSTYGGTQQWLTGTCGPLPCLSSQATPIDGDWDPTSLLLQFPAPEGAAEATTLTLEIHDGDWAFSTELPIVLLGGRWHWGDLHAHSQWSYDGCEDALSGCAPRGQSAAAEFFAEAASRNLDFVALTDHAESDWYHPDGLGGEGFYVWAGQADAVMANHTTVLPILGYEWTPQGGANVDGHRTVLLGEPTACPAYRIPARGLAGGAFESDVGTGAYRWDGTRTPHGDKEDLWRALYDAALVCDPVDWITFAHHPAYSLPKAHWWSTEDDDHLEPVVEIASEHGSSECLDTKTDGCSFRVNKLGGYTPEGSVQQALVGGLRLGFLGGTDSHDARPGSIEDGPGHTGFPDLAAPDGVVVQFADGALTGVLAPTTLQTAGVFEAIRARHTLATTGPRFEVLAWAQGVGGDIYLPGDIIPEHELPVTLSVEVRDSRDKDIVLELIDQSLEVVQQNQGPSWQVTHKNEAGGFLYLRLRIGEDSHRMWLSPWFVDPSSKG